MSSGPPEPSASGSNLAPPTCYRHPTRETYVRCTRCDRPICPECMHPASVGFQCPDDVRAGNAGARAARTTFGGRVSANAGAVTRVLLALNLVVFALTALSGGVSLGIGAGNSPLYGEFAMEPVSVALRGEYWRLLTATVLHYGVLHVAFNMFALYQLGPYLESLFGRVRFLAIYLVSGLGGPVAVLLLSNPLIDAAGASGGIFGLFGAYAVAFRRLGRDIGGIVGIVVVNFSLGLFLPGISLAGHLGGLLAGIAVTLPLAFLPARRPALQWAGVGGVVAALAVATALRVAQFQPF